MLNYGSLDSLEDYRLKVHIICEGPTDEMILKRMLGLLIKNGVEFVSPSSTQRKNRGVSSIIRIRRIDGKPIREINEPIFHKMLHQSYAKGSELIVISIDNDNDAFDGGIPIRKSVIAEGYDYFREKNDWLRDNYIGRCIIIPVQDIEYWLYVCKCNEAKVNSIPTFENIPQSGMKREVYGESVNAFGSPTEEAVRNSVNKYMNYNNIKNRLRRYPSYKLFEKELIEILGEREIRSD